MLSTKMSPNLQTQLFSAPQSPSQTLEFGESDEDAERKITLKYTERKLAEEVKAGIYLGDVEEVFDPKYVTPTNEDFMQSPP